MPGNRSHNSIDSPVFVFISLLATSSLTAPHDCNSWPLTPSHILCYCRPALLTQNSSVELIQSPNWLSLRSLCRLNREHCIQQFLYFCVCICYQSCDSVGMEVCLQSHCHCLFCLPKICCHCKSCQGLLKQAFTPVKKISFLEKSQLQ